MKHIYISIAKSALILVILLLGTFAHAQESSAPTLYDQNGGEVNVYNSETNSLNAGWYYSATGIPLYYYANGVYYDPSTQSYGGSILYPNAEGPQTLNSQNFTPGVPNTGVGGRAFYAWMSFIISATVAVVGTHILTRSRIP